MTRKMLLGMLLAISLLFAADEKERVYFPPDTPYLEKVCKTLNEQDYLLVEDSTAADWKGSLMMTDLSDSIRYEILLENKSGGPVLAGVFYLKPVAGKIVLKQIRNFSLWFAVTNLVILGLFFIRF
ncbi:MAG: hypothetical protein DRP86_05665 [Candidatus Neomarinimicrobiota bacterium]|nr:hypothetical protein [Candidatus Neomarinimicrobiota bacterium]RKY49235.1 MAG: hypothetical protein DRP86_05665 [Candidatus Neomarinimicrobiota bacterium]